jgi:hypothetical protein
MNLTVLAETVAQVQTPAQKIIDENQISTTPIPEIESPILETSKNDFIWQNMAVFSTIGWLLTLGFLFFKHKSTSKNLPEKQESPTDISLKTCVKNLKKACETNDVNSTKIALLEWGKLQFSEISLGAIAPHCEARLRDEILKLNATLYAKEPQTWQGRELFKAFSENNARVKLAKQEKSDALKPLYKL